jgi:hypothetical protein
MDMEIDIPKIWQYFGELIGPMVQDGSVPLSFLKEACQPLKESGKAGILVARNSWRYASLAVNRGAIKRGFTVHQ